jgi:hypothetical protein
VMCLRVSLGWFHGGIHKCDGLAKSKEGGANFEFRNSKNAKKFRAISNRKLASGMSIFSLTLQLDLTAGEVNIGTAP